MVLQKQASFRIAHKILVGARLLVLAYFYQCSHARFLVKVVFANCSRSLLARITFINACARKGMLCLHAHKDHFDTL